MNLLHLICKWRQINVSIYKCKYVNRAAADKDVHDPKFTSKDAADICQVTLGVE